MSKVALVIIYNHQHNENIEVLEQIYGSRFSNIYHLVPFYYGHKSNVIAVYESSYYFQGYAAQGFSDFFKKDYDHYFFIADDLLINPVINETNYTDYLKLGRHSCFITRLTSLHEDKGWWSRVRGAYRYNTNVPGIEIKNLLPDYQIALQAFNKFGLKIKPLSFNQIWKTPGSIKEFAGMIIRDRHYLGNRILNIFRKAGYDLSYPLIGGYSDIFVVSSDAIKQFCHYCGIFASTKLFVEFGIPTSLVLSAGEIVTEEALGLQGKALWKDDDFKILRKYHGKLSALLNDFPVDYLYLHPIKLTEWDTKMA
jgi:hypothetical protein